MSRHESFEAAGLLLAMAVVVLAVGLAIHLNPATVAVIIVVVSGVIAPPVAIRWAKRNRSSTAR